MPAAKCWNNGRRARESVDLAGSIATRVHHTVACTRTPGEPRSARESADLARCSRARTSRKLASASGASGPPGAHESVDPACSTTTRVRRRTPITSNPEAAPRTRESADHARRCRARTTRKIAPVRTACGPTGARESADLARPVVAPGSAGGEEANATTDARPAAPEQGRGGSPQPADRQAPSRTKGGGGGEGGRQRGQPIEHGGPVNAPRSKIARKCGDRPSISRGFWGRIPRAYENPNGAVGLPPVVLYYY